MLEIVGYIAAVVAIAIVGVLAFAATKPDTFSIKRSARIAAPAERIYPLIANLRSMNTWNPFVEPDPAVRISYSGPEMGQGATHVWAGNRNVGEGSVEVTEAVAPSRVAMRLLMVKPMKADNQVEFTLQPADGGTTVTWAMQGPQPMIGKVVSVFINCERMIGPVFEKGLSRLKEIAEAKA